MQNNEKVLSSSECIKYAFPQTTERALSLKHIQIDKLDVLNAFLGKRRNSEEDEHERASLTSYLDRKKCIFSSLSLAMRRYNILVATEEDITCSICLSKFINPMVTECGHSFCQGCIWEHLLRSNVSIDFITRTVHSVVN